MKELRFSGTESLTRWLCTTKWGAEVIRDVLHSREGRLHYQEHVERELACRPTYVLVKAHADGLVEVFGERHVRVQIVALPASDNAVFERLYDEWVRLNLKPNYAAVDYANCKRATEYVTPYWSASEFLQGELNKQQDVAFLEELKEVRS